MKRYSLLPLVVVAGVVIACSTRAWSQTREPMVLPNLLWLQQGPPQSAAMMWPLPNSSVSNPTPIIQDFEFGWNWTSVSWNMGRLLGVRRYHCNDFRQDADLMDGRTIASGNDLETSVGNADVTSFRITLPMEISSGQYLLTLKNTTTGPLCTLIVVKQ
jgi:hypothetical protein